MDAYQREVKLSLALYDPLLKVLARHSIFYAPLVVGVPATKLNALSCGPRLVVQAIGKPSLSCSWVCGVPIRATP